MGKAADNERIKLKATFLNNLGVGVSVAGFFIPLAALAVRTYEKPLPWDVYGVSIGVFLAAWLLAIFLHWQATRIIQNLSD